MRQALEEALGGAGGVITVDGATGMGKSRLAHEALDAVRGGRRALAQLVVRGRAVRCVEHLPDAARPAARRCSASRAPRRTSWARRSSPACERSAPDLLPMAPLLADVAQVERARHAGGRPDRPAVPRRPGGRRRHRPPRPARAGAARPRRRGGPLGGRRLGRTSSTGSPSPRPAGPGPSLVVRRGETGGFAPESGVRVAWAAAPRGDRAPRPRGHRGDPPAAARGGGHRRARRGQPALRRGGHPARPGLRLARSSFPSRCTPR